VSTLSDDGVRLWIDGTLLIDNWFEHPELAQSAHIELSAGRRYSIVLEYCEWKRYALVHLFWQSRHQAREVVPRCQLYPGAKPRRRLACGHCAMITRATSPMRQAAGGGLPGAARLARPRSSSTGIQQASHPGMECRKGGWGVPASRITSGASGIEDSAGGLRPSDVVSQESDAAG